MGFTDQKLYQEFKSIMDKNIDQKGNGLIITLPGFGASYFIKYYLQENPGRAVYIDSSGQNLGDYSVLDFSESGSDIWLKMAEEYFKKASLQQKLTVVISDPAFLESENYKKSWLPAHLYSEFYLRARDEADTEIFTKEINPKLDMDQGRKIFEWSGGIARIVKYLAFNPEELNKEMGELVANSRLRDLVLPIVTAAQKCNLKTRVTLGILEGEKFKSEILNSLWQSAATNMGLKIEVRPDLSVWEDGEQMPDKATKKEADILAVAINGEGIITKDKISEIKWGNGEYEKFSDQAVGKTIQRLNKKLRKYKFEAIIGVGYRLK